jgi:hypothetical protein
LKQSMQRSHLPQHQRRNKFERAWTVSFEPV